ncbi:MAG TPA: hypothetical protein VFQ67_09495 [Allosphingosinicella sp.]|jgi:hypothetical protein|nr:hypothetical protein [Allosphingosinicella sp.]
MRQLETWLTGLLLVAVTLLLPMAALEPVGRPGPATAAAGLAAGACEDGSAHLVMGCASILL